MDTDTVVIGAGVVGLAIARALARSGRETLVVERENAIGTATSSRNSGVVHAGIYYPTGSLKARLCVRGKRLLYEYCADRGVPNQRCGKLIVATTESETDMLRKLQRTAESNGVLDLEWCTAAGAATLEPEVRCVAALRSPSTGIVDVTELMLALRVDIEASGSDVALRTEFVRAEIISGGFLLTMANPNPVRISCRALVNAAGLDATTVATRIVGLAAEHVARTRYARGRYFALAGPSPFRGLIYPVPSGSGLGIHATVDLVGRTRFGPDVEWIDKIDYSFEANHVGDFAAAIRRYYPALDATRLAADYTGIRPRCYGPLDAPTDFQIEGPELHGVAGLVNLFGIESPGLTASLAIGEYVIAMHNREHGFA